MTYDEFEDEVRKMITDYDAPESQTEVLVDFLIESNNAQFIGELWEEVQKDTE